MMNAKNAILTLLEGEVIEFISIGDKGWEYKSEEEFRTFDKEHIGDALKILDFEFDSGYGREEGYAVYVYSKNWIILKGCYDGSEWYTKIPRNPSTTTKPYSVGG